MSKETRKQPKLPARKDANAPSQKAPFRFTDWAML